MRVDLGVVAKEELLEIQQWIARRSARSARRWRQTILRRIRLLSDAPFSGRRVAEQADENLREVWVGAYRVAYVVLGGMIIAVGNGAAADAPSPPTNTLRSIENKVEFHRRAEGTKGTGRSNRRGQQGRLEDRFYVGAFLCWPGPPPNEYRRRAMRFALSGARNCASLSHGAELGPWIGEHTSKSLRTTSSPRGSAESG